MPSIPGTVGGPLPTGRVAVHRTLARRSLDIWLQTRSLSASPADFPRASTDRSIDRASLKRFSLCPRASPP